MNLKFQNYLEGLTPKKRELAEEALHIYMEGERECVNKITCPDDIYKLMRFLSLESEEYFYAIFTRQNNEVIKYIEAGHGTQTETLADCRKIIREALLCKATVIYIVHNHPSGTRHPSRMDDTLTININNACKFFNIRLADHVIICNGNYYSYHEEGKL